MNILVIAAHSDDEVLGCGGTILKHISNGDNVKVIFVADGVGSRENFEKDVRERELATKNAMEKLGVKDYSCLGFSDNQMDSYSLLEIVKKIELESRDYDPEVIYTHFLNDLNVDHQLTSRAVLTAFRPLPGSSVKQILMFEVLSSTEWGGGFAASSFVPNYYVDISNFFKEKLSVVREYDLEMRAEPHARSYSNLTNLMRFRGNTVGVNSAEAFMLVRSIV